MRLYISLFTGLILILFATCNKDKFGVEGDLSFYHAEPQLDSLIVGFFCHGGITVSENTVNPEITNRFEKDFFGSYEPVWYFYNNMYGVIFKMDHTEYKVIYEYWVHSNQPRVEMLTYAKHCLKTEIPDKISNASKDKYGSAWIIQDGYEIHTAYTINYELNIETEDNKMTVFFKNNGDFFYSCID